MTHCLKRTTMINRPIDQVFAFFADAGNLQRLTPPELSFQILTTWPISMQAGTLIEYRLRLLGLPFYWQTLISSWDPPLGFTDEQRKGPYRYWRHRHQFIEKDGKTEMIDQVDYELPYGLLGNAIHPLVSGKLARIFDYRQFQIEIIFS